MPAGGQLPDTLSVPQTCHEALGGRHEPFDPRQFAQKTGITVTPDFFIRKNLLIGTLAIQI